MTIGSALGSAVLAVASTLGAVSGPHPTSQTPVPASSGVATAEVATATGRAAAWAWPLTPQPDVLRRFDPPDQPWLPGHRGADLRAEPGQPVLAPTAGTVTYAGRLAGRGVVVVAHADGLRSTFEPVTAARSVGTVVARGDLLGTVTSEPGHCEPATCVHWGVLRGRTYLDPLRFVGGAPVVLLPLP